ncbi:Stk1 family PASTA domain-containing Ser/Thr kinase [Propionibacterium australiense]|uniref:non-specific serine/threonine protein kinase n=1 Tax=Propionibacterium australiense TaxID=119981 RepID=A0A383S6S0_9ACTN|nr:Stk1 family PASTA domain-containing Ser/Thr kinase [Propionibacterium australiense]RLP08198.1 Stk1 family PASTA domain-containing Ser/Thr kinase [Propionibacterium australiense]RLP08274.1 Stk1 family PASTA domain-containing Ser/Thr kinase [Propionibacterium australiense]SYZ33114.1 non-specific serine/threonine protein kinase [Propionibacterium australiense]VEH89130.1 Serine/threonine-protein kinase pknB [Propionibacterium australiense]
MTAANTVLGGRYELQEIIGRGGMAEVWRARDLRLDRDVAIKRLRVDLATDPTFQARFGREAQSAAGLNHPNIVSVYDTGGQTDEASGVVVPYIVMELVSGRTLREMLREGRTIGPVAALAYAQGVLDALDYSHQHGIIHRDIKPANVMITPTGQVKVMDFGIARAVADTSATMTQTAAVIGTAQYLSPEQARGETVDSRSDIYSAGCLLYELLTGRPPFTGDSPVAVAYQHVRETAVLPSTLSPKVTPAIDAITMTALSKNPNDRYQTARAMREDIFRVLEGQQVTAQIPAVHADAPTAVIGRPARALSDEEERNAEDTAPEKKRRISTPTVILLIILALIAAGLVYGGIRLREIRQEAQQTTVPAVIGFTQEQAVSTLKNYHLDPQVQHTNGDSATKGQVTATDPAEGTTVPINSTVVITVNDGPAAGTVPDVTGMDEDDAREALRAAGFTNVVTKDAGEDQEQITDEAGKIIATNPAANTSVDPELTVTLYRATGRSRMPNVSSSRMTEAEAVRVLANAGFTNVQVIERETSDYPEGTVFDQSVAAGQLYSRTDQVTIQVAVAPAVTTTPRASSTPHGNGTSSPSPTTSSSSSRSAGP